MTAKASLSTFGLMSTYHRARSAKFNNQCSLFHQHNNLFFYKLRERKGKTLTRDWRDHKRTGTHKHTETELRYFDWHGRLSQSKESKCLWTHDKDGITREFTKDATFTLFRLRKTAVPVEISRFSFHVCACLSLSWSLQFLVRVFTFLSLNLKRV